MAAAVETEQAAAVGENPPSVFDGAFEETGDEEEREDDHEDEDEDEEEIARFRWLAEQHAGGDADDDEDDPEREPVSRGAGDKPRTWNWTTQEAVAAFGAGTSPTTTQRCALVYFIVSFPCIHSHEYGGLLRFSHRTTCKFHSSKLRLEHLTCDPVVSQV